MGRLVVRQEPCGGDIGFVQGGPEVSIQRRYVATRGANRLPNWSSWSGRRLPRLVGLEKSLEMMLQSKEITARRLGLWMVAEDDGKAGTIEQVEAAVRVAKRIANGEKQSNFR